MRGILGLLMLPIAPFALGFITGIVPGLLFGLPGWHEGAAVVIPIVWAVGYVGQRGRNYGDVNWVTLCIAVFGGVGIGLSIWLFGNITS